MTTITQRARRTSVLVILALLVSAVGAAGPWSRPARAATFARTPIASFDSHLLGKINHARASHGLRRLTLVAGTTDIAHGWACHMARYHLLAHNNSLSSALMTHGSSQWTTYAENVGFVRNGRRAAALFRSYMNSPWHRANILDPHMRYVGIWSKRSSDGYRYNTIDFVGSARSSYSNAYGGPRRSC